MLNLLICSAIDNQSEKVQSEKALPFNPYGIANTSSLVKKTADPDLRAKNKEELASMDCGEVSLSTIILRPVHMKVCC